MVFKDYAAYYNALYQDKDYQAEAQYIDQLVKAYSQGSRTLLELGAGSGKHAREFIKHGYEVDGLELSNDMLELALQDQQHENLSFTQGDIRDFYLDKQYDCITSMFHVFNYLTSLDDLSAAFANVRKHLKPGGLFLFESWYGPAVLTHKPEMRVKRIQFDTFHVTRLAEPVMRPQNNQVDVNYTLFVEDTKLGNITKNQECHSMRYLFDSDVRLMCEYAGLKLERSLQFLSNHSPSLDSWSVLFLVRG